MFFESKFINRHTCVDLEPFKKTFGLIEKTLLLEGSRLKNKSFPGSDSFLQANAFLLTLFSPLATTSVMALVSRLKLPATALMCRCVKDFVFSIHLSQNSWTKSYSEWPQNPMIFQGSAVKIRSKTRRIASARLVLLQEIQMPNGDAERRCCGHSVVRGGSFQQFAVFLPFPALVVPGAIEKRKGRSEMLGSSLFSMNFAALSHKILGQNVKMWRFSCAWASLCLSSIRSWQHDDPSSN